VSDVVSHYRILEKLGAGGMGEVYLAEDLTLKRRVAIKFIQPRAAADPEAGERLLREARAAARLDHPNICAIHEVAEDGGRSFIVMQYLEGETLDRRIRARTLDLDQAIAIGTQVADALRDAHAHGIIHRDIKPSNIIVTPRGQAKVMDFGLARVAAASQPDAETEGPLTASDAVIGTVPYMSPEQVKGDRLDARSDIFSFGATLYEAVTGRRPFAGESPAATASAILTSDPAPLARYSPSVPDELQRIVRKCLDKDRGRRYQSAADLVVDLEHLRRGPQSPSGSMAGTGPAPRVVTRSARTYFAAAAGVAAVLLAGSYFWLGRPQPATPNGVIGAIAVLPFANSSGDQDAEYLSDGISESLINHFSRVPNLRVMARTTVFRYKGRDLDPQAVGRELAVDGVVTGKVLRQGKTLAIQADLVRVADGAQIWGDRFDRPLTDVLAVQDEIAGQIADRLRVRLSAAERHRITKRHTNNAEAYDAYLKGRYFYGKLTEESLDRSITYFQQAIAIDPNYALAYAGLADTYSRLGGVFGFRSPRETLAAGQQYVTRALAHDPDLPEAHTTLAAYKLQFEWNFAEAERELKRAIDLNPNDSASYQIYGSYYQTLGQLDDALRMRELSRQLDPLSPTATANVGYPHYYAGRYDEAVTHFKKALELDANYYWSNLWIGQAYLQMGRHEDAIREIDHALRLSGGDTRPKATLGHAFAVAGRRADAIRTLADLEALSRGKYVSPYFLALIHVGLRQDEQALAALEAALAERHPYLILLKVEPVFNRLRSQPRFIALMNRIGLS
jgi:serine/threonine-protein kinase